MCLDGCHGEARASVNRDTRKIVSNDNEDLSFVSLVELKFCVVFDGLSVVLDHCKRKTPTYCRYIQNDSNMPAICRQVANSTSEVG